MLILCFVQILIVVAFILMFNMAQPVSIHDTKQTDIIVEDSYLITTNKDQWLLIIADSEKYLFEHHSSIDTYPLIQMDKSISKGDKISLSYYEAYNIFGRVNIIVAAQSETKIYRTLEEYNRAKQGLPIFVVISFVIIEIVYYFIIFIYFCL